MCIHKIMITWGVLSKHVFTRFAWIYCNFLSILWDISTRFYSVGIFGECIGGNLALDWNVMIIGQLGTIWNHDLDA